MNKTKIKLPPQDYQPSKAEMEKEYDMPGAKIGEVRKAFFSPVEVERVDEKKDEDG
ncbi:MAG: hypothetical protein OXG88_12000 [Gammaproteobacteria bacterium]|nr:hypothetical protein [Gammaproteobacteria bacterium]